MTLAQPEEFPAVAGWTPMPTSRRVGIYLLDVLIAWAVEGAAYGLLYLGQRGDDRFSIAAGVIVFLFLGLQLFAWLGKASRVAGLILKARYLSVETGRPSGGRLLAKHFLMAGLGVLTLGIAPLIMVFSTVKRPLMRNWFDRATGLMLVDLRGGRRPVEKAAPPRTQAIAPVAYPAPGWPVAAPQASVPDAPDLIAPPARPLDPADVFGPPTRPIAPEATISDAVAPASAAQASASATIPSGASAASGPATAADEESSFALDSRYREASGVTQTTFSPVQRVIETGGLITAAPSSKPRPATPVVNPSPRPAPVVKERPMAPASDASPQAVLGESTVLDLATDVVLGRNPSAPGSAPQARVVPVADPLASKTHLMLGRDDRGIWVLDLHSTNGVFVARAAGEPGRIDPFAKVHLSPGDRVLFADQTVSIR